MKTPDVKRTFLPGEKWVYYKIYINPPASDKLLVRTIYPLKNLWMRQHTIKQWFFVRYNDPEHHLRVRFRVTRQENVSAVIPAMKKHLAPYIANKQIHNIQIDTYRRETERYGRGTIEHCEGIFHSDSTLNLNILRNILENNENGPDWKTGLRITLQYLDDFGLSVHERKGLLHEAYASLTSHLPNRNEIIKNLGRKYRQHKYHIAQAAMGPRSDVMQSYLDQFSRDSSDDIRAIMTMGRGGKLEVDLHDLLLSLIHMSMNRLYKLNQRNNELLVYNFLFRHFKSVAARMDINNNPDRHEPNHRSSV
ncbi:MAG: thiopeptide-type bacteriocin biosynthesis protein [Bacteroidales bacterium]